MSISTWSFTRLWAATACCWLVATVIGGAAAQASGESGLAVLIALSVAAGPAFLAGSWAASHGEIAQWPVIRLIALWFFPIAILVGLNNDELIFHRPGFLATIVMAPIVILTVRWFELRSGRAGRVKRAELGEITPKSGTPIV